MLVKIILILMGPFFSIPTMPICLIGILLKHSLKLLYVILRFYLSKSFLNGSSLFTQHFMIIFMIQFK